MNPAEEALRTYAFSYPEVHEDFPWGERAIKVRGKVFIFMSNHEPGLSISVKLPTSFLDALELPNVKPTGYGLGKSGWVSARFPSEEEVPVALVQRWIDESYRAVAPKKLTKGLGAR